MDEDSRQDAEHYRTAAENASRDADALIAKLATAGLTASFAVAGLAEGIPRPQLRWAALAFGAAAVAAVANQRIGADALRVLCEKTYELNSSTAAHEALTLRFRIQQALNWLAVLLIATGFIVAVLFAFEVVGRVRS